MLAEPCRAGFLGIILMVLAAGALFSSLTAHAGGPRYVAGTTYFDSSAEGHPVLWSGGRVSYFTDRGDLSPSVTNAVANQLVAAAAAAWSAVPTAAVSITRAGSLAEDVDGSNVIASSTGITLPGDIQRTAIATPVGVVYDADGAVIDALFGAGASDPEDCMDSGVMNIVDNLAADGTIVHALILVNGRCTGTPAQLEQIQFWLVRAFGRVLGLAWSQANDGVLSLTSTPSYQELQGWPIMRPIDRNCDQLSTQCVPDPLQLRADDVAAVSRLYPVTLANHGNFADKAITATHTLSIHGSVYFRRGQGMQGVNVVARPVTPGALQPDDRFPVSAVTGFLFTGNRGNVVTGTTASGGGSFSDFGSEDPLLEGFYDLSGIPLPTGETVADYEVTLEAVNPLYTGSLAVGPYAAGSPTPSGTLPTVTLRGLTAGMVLEQNFTITDSAGDLQTADGGSFAAPAPLPPAGGWQGRLVSPGEAAWFAFPVQAGRHFTIESKAMDEMGSASEDKLRTVLGVWNASDEEGSPAVVATVAPFNGAAPGVTALGVDAIGTGELLLGVADQRGDGRPDYAYHGRLLYAATVTPERLPLTGGAIQIAGSGFHPGMTVTLGTNIVATVGEITPTRIVATAPAHAMASGSLDLVVRDPLTNGTAVIAGGISYGSADGDTMSIATAPPAILNVAAAAPFSVRVFGPDQVTPIAGASVTFSVLRGTAMFSDCSASICTLITGGDGYATATMVPGEAGFIKLRAALSNDVGLDAELTGVAALAVLPVAGSLMVAPGASVKWDAQVQVLQGDAPLRGAVVQWSGQAELAGQGGVTVTAGGGVAGFSFRVGPWPAGTSAPVTACLSGTQSCASFTVFVAHLESERLVAISGVAQSVLVGGAVTPVVMRLIAPGGQPVVGGVVSFSASVRSWTPACGPGGPCAEGTLLGVLSQTAVSDRDGLASFAPILPAGRPVRLQGQAGAEKSSTIRFAIEIQP